MSDLTPEALRELMNRTVGATSGRDMSPDDLKVLSNELFALAAKPATYNQTLYEGMASYASARTSAAYHAWAADRKHIEALEKPPRPSDLSDAVNLVQRAMTCIEAVPDGLWPAWDKELSEAFNCLDDAVGTPARCLEEAALVAKEDK